MSRASSPSTARRYGTARVCQLWEVPRSTVYERRARASRPVQPAAKRGPKQAWTDAALTERIRAVLTNSPFLGEGYRKAWARLRLAGVRTSKGRVLRLMREAGLLAPTRVGRRRGPRSHDGTNHHRASRRDVGDRRDRLPHHPRGQRHCLHRRGPLHAGMRWHPCGSSRHALRGAGAAAPGAAGALRRLRRRDRLGSEPAPRPRQPIPERPLPGRAELPRHPARARRSWRRPRATAAPSASSARSRSSCSGSRHSRPSSSYDSRCSRSKTATTRPGWSSATATAPRQPSARRSCQAPERPRDYR